MEFGSKIAVPLVTATLCTVGAFCGMASAQTYPGKPVTIVLSYSGAIPSAGAKSSSSAA